MIFPFRYFVIVYRKYDASESLELPIIEFPTMRSLVFIKYYLSNKKTDPGINP